MRKLGLILKVAFVVLFVALQARASTIYGQSGCIVQYEASTGTYLNLGLAAVT
jgi:hypothetical protein